MIGASLVDAFERAERATTVFEKTKKLDSNEAKDDLRDTISSPRHP
jgi:hypothetical protein